MFHTIEEQIEEMSRVIVCTEKTLLDIGKDPKKYEDGDLGALVFQRLSLFKSILENLQKIKEKELSPI